MTYKELIQIADPGTIRRELYPDNDIVSITFEINGLPIRCQYSADCYGLYGFSGDEFFIEALKQAAMAELKGEPAQ
jgi:hypothetical protein